MRSVDDVRELLLAGADKVGINTAAIADPELVRRASDAFGNQAIVVAVDARREPGGDGLRWQVYTHGGRRPTGLDAIAWCEKMAAYGAGEILLTSMDRDGTRDGFDLELTRAVADRVPIPVIASGGVGKLEHLYRWHRRRARRGGAGGVDLPLRRAHGRRGARLLARARHPGAR